jgi:ribonuclease H / adenosylcobalamin/alpha-ribazole phosphatase
MGQLLSSLKPLCSSSPLPWRPHDRVLEDALVTRMFIIRHAAAVNPDDLRLPGPDVGLLPAGKAQAREVAHRMRDFAPSVVYTSDARRARETGEIIAAACQIPLEVSAGLGEIDFGRWAGRTYADLVAADPAARTWFTNPSTGAPPGGESLAVAAERVLRVMRELAHGDTERVAIVGHAGSLRLALAQALGMTLSSYWRLRLDCASLSVLTWAADGPLLERLNDTAHLEAQTPDLPRVLVTERG